ncbi:MAG: GvpL/GvpF family gas vesicle protein [Candidatus Omnitrophota bacterium]|nr:GvpL/GvpF family gas vesicle protein [Candidatus Omnitrophota bacterium]
MEKVFLKEGKYIYCIIASNEALSFGPLGVGGRGDELHTILYDDISAVVSNSPIISYSVSRENMLAHEKAIEEIMKKHTVLPVRFCTIAQDDDKVKKILEIEHDKFAELLKDFDGKKELGLKAIFKEEIIYKEISEKYEDIRSLKKALLSDPPAKTYYLRVEVGRKVEAALQEERDIYKEEILNTLSPLSQDTKVNAPYGELMIISAAFLVENSREAEFDQNVQALADKYGDKIKFKYTGTLPPFNFVNLVIETGRY